MKGLPSSESAENAVLSAMIAEEDLLNEGLTRVKRDDFFSDRNKTVFLALKRMYDRNLHCNLVTLAQFLKDAEAIDQAGGVEYISGLADSSYSFSAFEEYCDIVVNKAIQRRVVQAAREIEEYGMSIPHNEVSGLVDTAEEKIFAASSQRSSGPVRVRDTVLDTLAMIEERTKNDSPVTGYHTGLRRLDHLLAGWNGGKFYIVAARPGMGKSALKTGFALNAAIHHNVPVYIFSLEMSKEEETERMIVHHSGIDGQKVRRGELTPSDFKNIGQVSNLLAAAPLYIEDKAAITPSEVRSYCRRLVKQYGSGLIIVDYLQLMGSSANAASREREVAQMSASLKNLARELDCPVLGLSQLNRGLENRPDKRPLQSDLRESGALEQDADSVIFLYRPSEYYGDFHEGIYIAEDAEVIVAKQRNGPTGTIHVHWNPVCMKFSDKVS